jgi:XTP/dITP diphosphohydrolase
LPTDIIIASANAHKAEEIQALLGPEFLCRTLRDFPDAPEVEEDAATFAGNAVKKALTLVNWLKQSKDHTLGWVLADDSGLEVDALDGAPGVHSARYAATERQPGNSPDEQNIAKLLLELKGRAAHHRAARFRCVIALAQAGQYSQPKIFNGTCEGHIETAPRGKNGFGYDPLFVPEGHEQTFSELGESVKSQLSHRSVALRQLKDWLATR